MVKKRIFKYSLIMVFSIILAFSINLIYYFSTTLSVQDCRNYCLENTERNSTYFSRIGDGRYVEDYAYFIAANGDPDKPQEIFIFKKKFWGSFSFDRYEFIMSSTQSDKNEEDETEFGSIHFFTRNDAGEKETGATLLFFGANMGSDITEYEYTLKVGEKSNIYKKSVTRGEFVWFIKFYDLGNADKNNKKTVSDIKFYDSKGNLVGIY